jgi:hypothetical protein
MTEMLCGYIDRDETIVAFLYDDLDANRRRDFEAHALTCAVCRDEVAGLRRVRAQLAKWEPPTVASLQSSISGPGRQPWWRAVPAWAQVAAALLFLGVSAGIANLDVHYDQNGLSVRTGWLQARPGGSAPSPTASVSGAADAAHDAPWRADLAVLEQQLKTEFHAAQVSVAVPARAASSADAETLRRVRILLDESEKRQQRELALRVAEVLTDVNRQRQADLVKVDSMQNRLGVEVLQQRQSLNYFMRVNQRQ